MAADISGMTNRLESLPDGYAACVWCGAGNRLTTTGDTPNTCHACGLNPMPTEDRTKGGKVDPGQARKASRNRRGAPKQGKLGTRPVGKPVIGVDPGARYTGVVVRDGDVVLHASTLVRPVEMTGTDWAILCVEQVRSIVKDFPATMPMGVEGVSDPKGFHRGKSAAINPKDILRAGIVLGAVVAVWPTAHIIKPGGNGSQHYSHYPAALIGRRPADLPGSTNSAGTRDHEQSAYDVAGKTAKLAYPTKRKKLLP